MPERTGRVTGFYDKIEMPACPAPELPGVIASEATDLLFQFVALFDFTRASETRCTKAEA